MDIKGLEWFLAIADGGNISRAAAKLYVSQPAHSQQIKRLEDDFGHRLLLRTNKGVRLTEAGAVLESYARTIIKLYHQAREEADQLHDDRKVVRVDSNLTLATYALPCMIFALKRNPAFQDYYFDLTFSTVNAVENNLLNGISDVGYVNLTGPYPDIRYVKVGSDRLILAAAAGLKVPARMTLEEAMGYPIILLEDIFHERKPLEQTLGPAMAGLNPVMSLDSTESVKTAVFREFGLSFVPMSSVKKELRTGAFKEIEVVGLEEEYPIYLCYRAEAESNPNLRPVLDFLRQRKTQDFC